MNKEDNTKKTSNNLLIANLILVSAVLILVAMFGAIGIIQRSGTSQNENLGRSKSECQAKWNSLQKIADQLDEGVVEQGRNIMGDEKGFMSYCTTGNKFDSEYDSNVKIIKDYLAGDYAEDDQE